jgi:hypothetical protein
MIASLSGPGEQQAARPRRPDVRLSVLMLRGFRLDGAYLAGRCESARLSPEVHAFALRGQTRAHTLALMWTTGIGAAADQSMRLACRFDRSVSIARNWRF